MEDADHSFLLQPHDHTFRHCRSRPKTQQLPRQASLSAEFVRTQNCNYGFLPLFGYDSDLDLAFLDVEHRIRRFALREDHFIFTIAD